MKRYNVYVSPEARADLKEIADYIADTFQAPATAKKYAKGLVKALMSLCTYAEAIPVASYKSVRRYGINARSITYKKSHNRLHCSGRYGCYPKNCSRGTDKRIIN